MLKSLFKNFINNITNQLPINDLSKILYQLKNLIRNSKVMYDIATLKPDLLIPIKNSSSYKTHNFITQYIDFNFKLNAKFIICCDILTNNANKNNYDVCILENNININAVLPNNSFNFTKIYRITATHIKLKANNIKAQLKYLDNLPNCLLSSINSLSMDNKCTYFNGTNMYTSYINTDINNSIPQNEFTFPFTSQEFHNINKIPNKNWYYIIECNNCEYLQITKHVEHIPILQYQQIFNISINENVW